MSAVYKLYLETQFDGEIVEKSLIGELKTPTISSFGDFIKLLEPNIYQMPSPKSDFFSIRLDVCIVNPDFDIDGNKSISK